MPEKETKDGSIEIDLGGVEAVKPGSTGAGAGAPKPPPPPSPADRPPPPTAVKHPPAPPPRPGAPSAASAAAAAVKKPPPARNPSKRPDPEAETYQDVVSVGADLGTSTSKYCDGERVLYLLSVVGDTLTERQEDNWRRMNRSPDQRWAHNLAIWDDRREEWRYVGSMTRSSQQPEWYTEGGVLQDLDDAYLGFLAGIFLLGIARGEPLKRVAVGFGVPISAGEHASEAFLDQVRSRLVTEEGRRMAKIKAKNVATNEVQELSVEIVFMLMQFQAFGAFMVLLFSKFDMELYNTYVIDIGHGTWISLPVIDNEADIALADSQPNGIHKITSNISRALYEQTQVKVPEQRLMQKLAAGERVIEVPGAGEFNFADLLDKQCDALAETITKKVRTDAAALAAKGANLDYVAIVGGGSHLVYDKLKWRLAEVFGWNDSVASERIVGNADLDIDARYVNAAGLMLLARDQIAMELDQEVDPTVEITSVVSDTA